MPVNPTGADLKRYLAEDPGGPVVMLNLLRFKPDGGRESYARYSAALADYLPGIGARVLYIGDTSTTLVAPEGHDWDAVLLVEYPSRAAFSGHGRRPGVPEGHPPAHGGAHGGGTGGHPALGQRYCVTCAAACSPSSCCSSSPLRPRRRRS